MESFNRLSEDEFFVHVQPNTPEELLAAATQYVRYFNTERHNSYKGATPRELLQKAAPAIDPRVLSVPVIDLDRAMNRATQTEYEAFHKQAREIKLQEQIRIPMRMPAYLPRVPTNDQRVARDGESRVA